MPWWQPLTTWKIGALRMCPRTVKCTQTFKMAWQSDSSMWARPRSSRASECGRADSGSKHSTRAANRFTGTPRISEADLVRPSSAPLVQDRQLQDQLALSEATTQLIQQEAKMERHFPLLVSFYFHFRTLHVLKIPTQLHSFLQIV